MTDLHDVRAELRDELDRVRRERTVPHAVPPVAPVSAQKRGGGGVLGGVIGALVVVLVAVGLAIWGRRQ
jgi:hypothetical protein